MPTNDVALLEAKLNAMSVEQVRDVFLAVEAEILTEEVGEVLKEDFLIFAKAFMHNPSEQEQKECANEHPDIVSLANKMEPQEVLSVLVEECSKRICRKIQPIITKKFYNVLNPGQASTEPS